MEKSEKSNLVHLSELKIIDNRNNNDESNIEIETKIGCKNSRYYIIDNLKGILIFTVVFAHFLFEYSNRNINSLSRKIVVFIYSFHMQAFIFISGFLTSENSIMLINAIKLLILYYIFNFSFSIILFFYLNSPINFLYPVYSYWYLLSLFYWRILIIYLTNIKFIFIWSVIIALLAGYWDCFSNVMSIYRTIIFFHYFLAGFKIAKMKIIDKFIFWKKGIFKFLIYLFCFFIFLFFFLSFINKKNISNSTLLMSNYNEDNTIKQRITIFISSYVMILFLFLLLPNVKIPILNKWGKNSLYIYLFHRLFTIITQKEFFCLKKNSDYIIIYSVIFTLILLIIFGSDIVTSFFNSSLNYIHKNLVKFKLKGQIICNIFILSFVFILLLKPASFYYTRKINFNKYNIPFQEENSFLRNNIKDSFLNSIKISYVGDLILLKDNVIGAKNNLTGKYEFDGMFQYTKDYFHKSDLSIGVYEGPSAGNNTSFSTGNYDDGIPLYLNFPDEFAEAVKKAGINLVTTANNHLLDKKLDGAMRTLDILDKYNISHVGSYRNYEEKNKVYTINIKNVKIAVLAYTSLMNNFKMDLLYEKYNYLTNIIPKKSNKYYEQIYKEIENDFYKAKKEMPDIIMVLAHMGDEFIHHTNEFQDKWNKIFSDLGADIILGDHSHAVQPLQYIGKTLVINSPGNFANCFIKFDGDSTAIINIYIHKKFKKVIGASVIPMYTKEIRPKYFSAIPIYDLMNDKTIPLNEKERKRVEEIQLMSTKVLVGKGFSINEAKKEYFFINNSYYDFNENESFCNQLEKYNKNEIYRIINNSNSITFIGDSITEGTKNGYHPWFEPMIKCFKNKKIINISKGSYTTKLILNTYSNDIINSNCDLYIIAIGTNDIRYRDPSICAMNSKEFINELKKIVDLIKDRKAKFIFIAPWLSLTDDFISKINHEDKKELIKQYSLELKNFAKRKNYIFVDPNEYLEKIINKDRKKYMIDFIHPNNNYGIQLYCESIFIK